MKAFSGNPNIQRVIFQSAVAAGYLEVLTGGQDVHLSEYVPRTRERRKLCGQSSKLIFCHRPLSSPMAGELIGSCLPSATSMPGWTTRSILSTQTTLRSTPMHYGSINSIRDLKYLKMQRPSFCSILIKYTIIKF